MNTIPQDVLLKIFSYLPLYEVSNSYTRSDGTYHALVCKRWARLMLDINIAVGVWRPAPGFNGYMDTQYLLKFTKFIPTPETVKKLVWTHSGNDRLMDLFLECYHPVLWKNMPQPTWEQVMASTSKLSFARLLQRSLFRGHHTFSYIWRLIKINNPAAIRTLHLEADALETVAVLYPRACPTKFVEWLVHHPCCEVTAHGLAKLVSHGYPLNLIKGYAQLPKIVRNWDTFERCPGPNYASRDEALVDINFELWKAYSWRLISEMQADRSLDYLISSGKGYVFPAWGGEVIKGYVYFYKQCPLWKIQEVLLGVQGMMRGHYKSSIPEHREQARKYIEYFEKILAHCGRIHPTFKLYSYTWYTSPSSHNYLVREDTHRY